MNNMEEVKLPPDSTWTEKRMMEINALTPDIKGKAFDPSWAMLRMHLEEYENLEQKYLELKEKQTKFETLMKGYDFTYHIENGEIWALTAGDQGWERTGIFLNMDGLNDWRDIKFAPESEEEILLMLDFGDKEYHTYKTKIGRRWKELGVKDKYRDLWFDQRDHVYGTDKIVGWLPIPKFTGV